MVHILTIYFFTNTIMLLAIKEVNMENAINFIALYLIGFLIGKGTIKILSFIKSTTLKVLTNFKEIVKNKRRKNANNNWHNAINSINAACNRKINTMEEKILATVEKLKEIEAHLTFFSHNGCTKRDCEWLANDIEDFLILNHYNK